MGRVFGLIVLSLLFSGPISAEKNKTFVWYNAEAGFKKAAGGEKLIMVDVYTSWCGWCKKLDQNVFSRSDIQAYLSLKFVPVKLNAEDTESQVQLMGHDLNYAQLARVYGVSGYPSILFLEPDGKLLYKLSGYQPPEKFMEVLKFFGEREYEKEQEKQGE